MTKHTVVLLTALALLATALAFSQPSTLLNFAQIAAPPSVESRFLIVGPSGFLFARPDSSIVIDSTNPADIRVRANLPPPAAVPQDRTLSMIGNAATLPGTLAPGYPVVIFRNGLKQTETVDYARDGNSITFNSTVQGDINTAMYWTTP